jgi:hypothetical protein
VETEVIYCQSSLRFARLRQDYDEHRCPTHENEKMPKPSLLRLPPNRFVSKEALSPIAFDDARHGIETELSQGII